MTLNVSPATPDKEKGSQHQALTPNGSFSPVVKQFLESVMPTPKKAGQAPRHRRNHSGGSLKHFVSHNQAMTRGRSLDQVDASQVLVNIEHLNLLSAEDGVTESQSELDSLQKTQLVNLTVSDSEMDGEAAPQITITSSHNTAFHEDSSSVELLDAASSQGEEGDDEEDYQPSSDPVPETPTGNEDYSSIPSSPDLSYTMPPNAPPMSAARRANSTLKKKGSLALLKCYFDSPLPKSSQGEFDDSGFHVSTIENSFNNFTMCHVFTDPSNEYSPNR